ncbi:hypothetical protein INS49_013852 [Diaporthe citri]|uniref:uncharacterized protein n=1 Tax=Diaporthe citri TaxID=83186 RepID=UPI001C80E572|nr:uncharacterized protein INS49_013852 [Diaporthe citri]KAG6357969.1 hypothetical protein INS49_013852 [Diaporthe citri]
MSRTEATFLRFTFSFELAQMPSLWSLTVAIATWGRYLDPCDAQGYDSLLLITTLTNMATAATSFHLFL